MKTLDKLLFEYIVTYYYARHKHNDIKEFFGVKDPQIYKTYEGMLGVTSKHRKQC